MYFTNYGLFLTMRSIFDGEDKYNRTFFLNESTLLDVFLLDENETEYRISSSNYSSFRIIGNRLRMEYDLGHILPEQNNIWTDLQKIYLRENNTGKITYLIDSDILNHPDVTDEYKAGIKYLAPQLNEKIVYLHDEDKESDDHTLCYVEFFTEELTHANDFLETLPEKIQHTTDYTINHWEYDDRHHNLGHEHDRYLKEAVIRIPDNDLEITLTDVKTRFIYDYDVRKYSFYLTKESTISFNKDVFLAKQIPMTHVGLITDNNDQDFKMNGLRRLWIDFAFQDSYTYKEVEILIGLFKIVPKQKIISASFHTKDLLKMMFNLLPYRISKIYLGDGEFDPYRDSLTHLVTSIDYVNVSKISLRDNVYTIRLQFLNTYNLSVFRDYHITEVGLGVDVAGYTNNAYKLYFSAKVNIEDRYIDYEQTEKIHPSIEIQFRLKLLSGLFPITDMDKFYVEDENFDLVLLVDAMKYFVFDSSVNTVDRTKVPIVRLGLVGENYATLATALSSLDFDASLTEVEKDPKKFYVFIQNTFERVELNTAMSMILFDSMNVDEG